MQLYEVRLRHRAAASETGKIKVLAVNQHRARRANRKCRRSREAGYPALTVDGLVGLFGPTGMPRSCAIASPPTSGRSLDTPSRSGWPPRARSSTSGPGRVRQIDRRAARGRGGIRQGAGYHGARQTSRLDGPSAGSAYLITVCTLMAICHWPLRFTQTRAARNGGRDRPGPLVAVIAAPSSKTKAAWTRLRPPARRFSLSGLDFFDGPDSKSARPLGSARIRRRCACPMPRHHGRPRLFRWPETR